MTRALSEAAFQALAALVTEHLLHKDICKPGDAESIGHLFFWGTSWFLGFSQPWLHGEFLPYPLNQPVLRSMGTSVSQRCMSMTSEIK